MSKKLFVGNLPRSVDDEELKAVFEPYGSVVSSQVIKDKQTGGSRGFGFVEMESEDEAQTALKEMEKQSLQGRPLTINIARPFKERSYSSHDSRRSPRRTMNS